MNRKTPDKKQHPTPEQAEILRANANKMTVKALSGRLNVGVSKVYEWIKYLGIKKERRQWDMQVDETKEKFFNPYEYDDWVTSASFKTQQVNSKNTKSTYKRKKAA